MDKYYAFNHRPSLTHLIGGALTPIKKHSMNELNIKSQRQLNSNTKNEF